MTELQTWQQIVLAVETPICAFDHECRLIAFNQAHNDEFFRVWGFYTKIGDVFPDLFTPDQQRLMRSLMTRALTGEVFEVVEEFGSPDRSKPAWEIRYAPLRDSSGEIIGAFHLAQDVSARLRSAAEQESSQRALLDAKVVDLTLRRALNHLDEEIRELDNPAAIATLAAKTLGRALSASVAGLGTLRPDGVTLDIDSDWTAPGAMSVVGTHRMTGFGIYLDLLKQGEDLVLDDVEKDERGLFNVQAFISVGARAAVNIPVMEDGRCVAIFFVLASNVRHWSRVELNFIRNVAVRVRVRAGVVQHGADALLKKDDPRLLPPMSAPDDAAVQARSVFVVGSELAAPVLSEAQRRENDARSRQIIDSAIDYAIVATDLDGRITGWSKGAQQVLGWSEGEMLGKTAERIFTPEDVAADLPREERRQALTTGHAIEARWHRRRDGTRFWAAGEMIPLRHDGGNVFGFVKVLRERAEPPGGL